MTSEKYVMYISGVPFVSKQFDLYKIMGEVYEVDKLTLNDLDMLEGHPNWYKRELILVSYVSLKGKMVNEKAWLYFNEDIPNSAQLSITGMYGLEKLTDKYKSLLS